jgi:DNA ligase D-like protein (predicted ligase)
MRRTPRKSLPQFIPPMLAQLGEPFDSVSHLFEIKWDGTRTLAFIEGGTYRLTNRHDIDMTARYPEFAYLAALPPGTILDGETVVLRGGKPDFAQLLTREQTRGPLKIRSLARTLPATYIVFDLLYEGFQSTMDLPLNGRRARLRRLLAKVDSPHLLLSEGWVGAGRNLFVKATAEDLEGVIAKRLSSSYQPGKRTDAWIKIKKRSELLCAIIGFLPNGPDDFRSLILAVEEVGCLRCVGKVGTGFDDRLRRRIAAMLSARLVPHTTVPNKIRSALWVSPGLFCRVSFLERTAGGELRAPSFKELIVHS